MTMMQRLGLQLPDWARKSSPIVRYELEQNDRRGTRRRRYGLAVGLSLLVVVLFIGGYLLATNLLQNPPGQTLSESAMAVAFWPLLGLQLVLQIAALVLTTQTVSEHKRRQSWDNLRATASGAGLTLRARWISVYYRLSPLLVLVLAVRVILIALILYDLTGFQGRYIDLLIQNITPTLSPIIGTLLVAVVMTAGVLLPFTSIGLDAAWGLFISVNVAQRVYAVLAQMLLILFKLMTTGLLILLTTQYLAGSLPETTDAGAWLLLGGFGAWADWGLRFLHLGFFSEVWATIPYAILFGVALLGYALLQSLFSEWLLGYTIRRAERIG